MPLYEFYCHNCDGRFEKLLIDSNANVAACRLCGSGPVRRLVSACNFVADNTSDAIMRKVNADKDDINSRIRQFDPKTLEDIYGKDKAKNIYSGAEGALSCKPLVKDKHKKVAKQFKNNVKKSTK
jgi:putative FmdB family regulatory protein